MDENAMIEFKNFSFWYPETTHPALDEINLVFPDGIKVLILGPSGCGKSTLLLAMNGVVPQLTGGDVKGKVFVNQQDTRETPVAQLAGSVGLILQDPESQLTNLYVFDEVAFGPENLNLAEDEIIRRVNLSINKTGLDALRNSSVFALSGGQKQRVAIASAIAMLPNIMLLDNPTSNLDPVGSSETYRTIRELSNYQEISTIIMADHHPDELIDTVDRLMIMDKGKIILDGEPRAVLEKNGRFLKEELGIFLPQVSDLGLSLKNSSWSFNRLPLTVHEVQEQFLKGKFIKKVDPVHLPEPSRTDALGPTLIQIKDVQFAYPNGSLVVKKVSLDIHEGEFMTLVGKNGSGKTTLAKMIVGLLKPGAGSIELDGKNLREIPLRNMIGSMGYVFQYPEHQFVAQNVFDEVAFSLRALKKPEDQVITRVEEILELFSLQELRTISPLTLSKGQKRRLSVATMLVTRPRLLILDEPMTGQDHKNIINLLEILNHLRQEGTTIIEITHDMEHVASYANRVIGMSEGEKLFDGSPAELFTNPGILAQLNLEAPPMVAVADSLRSQGVQLPDWINTVDRLVGYLDTNYE
jgi:energy-coupling factor transporter ATP-binding protein EcfA2